MTEAFQQTPIQGVAGEPELLTAGNDGPLASLPQDEYSETLVGFPKVDYLQQVAPFVGKDIKNLLLMTKKPDGLSSHAQYGLLFPLEREFREVGWILDGNEKDRYVLYLDLNVNGDLTDDPPIRFEKRNGAIHSNVRAAQGLFESGSNEAHNYPATWRGWEVSASPAFGKDNIAAGIDPRGRSRACIRIDWFRGGRV